MKTNMNIILVAVLLLLFCEVVFCAESQPPTPNKGKASSQKQEKTTQIDKKLGDLKHPPTSHSVESVEARNPEPQIAKNQKDDKTPSEWWLIGLTAILSLATTWLVIETRRLVTETALTSKRQAAETEAALKISHDAANAARQGGDVVDIFTFGG